MYLILEGISASPCLGVLYVVFCKLLHVFKIQQLLTVKRVITVKQVLFQD